MALVQALEFIARRQPTARAVSWRATSWTYEELRSAIAIIDGVLHARGLEAGARVALLLRNSTHYVALYYGVLSAACVCVPLNVHERAPALAKQIADSGAVLLIGDIDHPEWTKLAAAVAELPIDVVSVQLRDGDAVSTLARALGEGSEQRTVSEESRATVAEDSLASIVYTSGTTGRPKGVMLSHRNLESNARAIISSLGLTADDHSLCVLPFHFSYGNSVLHSHLLAGATLTLEDNFAFPHVLLQRMASERVSGFAGVPSTFALLLGRHRLNEFDLGNLRYITQAGGPMPRALIDKLREQLPEVLIFSMYGQTEATARITCLPPADLDRKFGSVGVPVDDVEVEIRDAGRVCACGDVGEIFVRGPNVMLGYWNDPAATAEVLEDGWLRTRDLGHLDDDGYLYVVGRTSDMIKVGAFRVGPQEIEEVIAGLDGVEEVAVVGIADDVLGQAVKAVIVLRPGATLAAMTVKAHCRESLAAYKVPKVVEFAATLPRTASGKVQRFKLAGE